MASISTETRVKHGHIFIKKTFHKPIECHHCMEFIWIMQQENICEVCNLVVHDRCLELVVSTCFVNAATLIKRPVPHCWSGLTKEHKKKFCNICRKRLDDIPSRYCEICEYFVHEDCQDAVVADCKEIATYPGRDLQHRSIMNTHYWREGNLPNNSKCAVCKKSCFTAECLTGFRCGWCGITSHAYCYKNISQECTFGDLEPIYVPPQAVSIPRTDIPVEAMIGIRIRRQEMLAHNIREQFDFAESEQNGAAGRLAEVLRRLSLVLPRSCRGNCHASPPYVRVQYKSEEFGNHSKEIRKCEAMQAAAYGPRPSKEKEDKDRSDEAMINVCDGDYYVTRKMFRVIWIHKEASIEQFLTSVLREYRVTGNSSDFSLIDLYGLHETPLRDPNPISTLFPKEGRLGVVLRYKAEKNSGEIEIYPDKLQVSEPFIKVHVGDTTTIHNNDIITNIGDLIREVRERFDLQNVDSDFRCSEILLDSGVTRKILHRNENPWCIVRQLAKLSVRRMEVTRFYLQLKHDPHGPNVALFVGNLPKQDSERRYEKFLKDILGKDKFAIGPIYYEYASMVIIYDKLDAAVRALYILRETNNPDNKKPLTVMILPSIEPSMIPMGVQPLLVFVNVKSGGCQGAELISSFRKLLNPYQVFDLDNGGPLPGLYVFRHIKAYKILVCGGDGTVGWVLQCLDNVGQDSQCSSPACAIVPLGTGNDLARVLCWGSGYTGDEDPLNLLQDVIDAEEIILDRWTILFHRDETQEVHNAACAGTSKDNTQVRVMNNYFGIGVDADLCLDFHNAREENPDKFKSRFRNKGVYVRMGLRKMVQRKSCKDLHKEIRLEVDGKLIELPQVEGIIILNILSWGSGANPWGPDREDKFYTPNHWDGMLEIVGVTGVMHLGQIQSGLRTAIRIAQGGHIKIHLNSDIAVQLDGEPWIQSPGDIVILKSALTATMLKKSKIKHRNTEPSIPPNGEGGKSTDE